MDSLKIGRTVMLKCAFVSRRFTSSAVVVILVSAFFWGMVSVHAETSPFSDRWYGFLPAVRADLNDALSCKVADETGNAEVQLAVTVDLIDPEKDSHPWETHFLTTIFSHATGRVGYTPITDYLISDLWRSGAYEIDLANDGGQWISMLDWYFPYYGAWYDRVFVSANGFVVFGQEGAVDTDVETIYTVKTPSDTYPNQADPDGVMAPLWRDLNPASVGRIAYGFYVIGGYNTFVIAWEGVENNVNSNVQSFAIWLQPDNSGGLIRFVYKTLTRDVSTTVGMENPFGTAGVGDLYNQIPDPTPSLMSTVSFVPNSYNMWEIVDVRVYAGKYYPETGYNDREAEIYPTGSSSLSWGGLNVQLYDPGPGNPPPDFDDIDHRRNNRILHEGIGLLAGAIPVVGPIWNTYNFVKDVDDISAEYQYTSATTDQVSLRGDSQPAMAENLPQNNMNPSDKVFHLWTAPVFRWQLYDDEIFTQGGLAANQHYIRFWGMVEFERDDGSRFFLTTGDLNFKIGKCGVEGIQNGFYDHFDDGFIEIPTYNPGSLETWSVIKGIYGDVSMSPIGLGYSEDYSLVVDWTANDQGLARVVSPALPIDFTRDYSIILYMNMTSLGRNGHLVVMDDGRIEVFVQLIDSVATLCVATSTGYIAFQQMSFNQWHRVVAEAFPSLGKFKLFLDSAGGGTLYDFRSLQGGSTVGFGSGSVSQGSLDAGEARWDDVGVYGYRIPFPSISLTSPNGGESLSIGATSSIDWDYADNPGSYVEIQLYEGISPVRTIVASTPCDGSYLWTLPTDLVVGSDYRIKVRSTSTDAYDYSDAYFSIDEGTIMVTSPNGGEDWERGRPYAVTWISEGNPGNYVDIDLLKGGQSVLTIASSTENDGSHSWQVPLGQELGADYQIRVSSTSTSASDVSDAFFSIVIPYAWITVLSPNGGEIWEAGGTYDITWITGGDPISSVYIDLYDGEGMDSYVGSSVNDGVFAWTIPSGQELRNDYYFRIGAGDPYVRDFSDGVFSIVEPVPRITVTSPNGGETWALGDQVQISWTSANLDSSELLYIHLVSAVVGASYTITSSTLNDGSFSWIVCQVWLPGPFYITIGWTEDPSICDDSDATFSIVEGTATVPSAPLDLIGWATQWYNKEYEVILDWDPPSSDGGTPITHYNVYRALVKKDKPLVFVRIADDVDTSFYKDWDGQAGKTYIYYVTAVNVIGESPPSNQLSVRLSPQH